MPGLVLHHVGIECLGERLRGVVPDQPERGQCQPFDENLHAQVCHVPAGVGYDVIEDGLEAGIDRVCQPQFLSEVARIDLDVPGLVHHLSCRIELGIKIGHSMNDLRRAD